jgi:hypothetical protein
VSADPAVDIDFQTNDDTQVQTVTTTVTGSGTLTADVQFSGCGVAPGNSLLAGKGFKYNFYDITASGTNAAGTAKSVQTQGVRFPAASC